MSENMKCKVHVNNQTGGVLNLSDQPNLKHGKYTTNPPTNIDDNTQGEFESTGREGSATGTEGYVEYTDMDGATFKISWDVPFSGQNSASITWTNASDAGAQYTYGLYNEGYTEEVNVDNHDDDLKLYCLISREGYGS